MKYHTGAADRVRAALPAMPACFTLHDMAAASGVPNRTVTVLLANMLDSGELRRVGKRTQAGQALNVYAIAPRVLPCEPDWDGPTGINWENGAAAFGAFLAAWPGSPLPEGYAL